jgi:NAD(P)-dependent dehydrogenase (short-subunit alcohol dehydrogenase family)
VDPIVSLQGRTIVVTGAGQGIGKGIVELAIELGANVVAVDLNGQTLDAAVSPLPQARVLAVQGSVADPAVADRAVADAVGAVASARGVTRAQVAIAWLLSPHGAGGGVVAPIVGPQTVAEVEDLVAGTGLELTREEVQRLEAPYRPKPVLGHF